MRFPVVAPLHGPSLAQLGQQLGGAVNRFEQSAWRPDFLFGAIYRCCNVGRRNVLERVLPTPDHQRGPVVQMGDVDARVAGCLLHASLVRLDIVQAVDRQQLAFAERHRAELRSRSAGIDPTVQPVLPFSDLADLDQFFVQGPVPAPGEVIRPPVLLDVQNRSVQSAVRPLRRFGEHASDRQIDALQRVERESGLAVVMLQQPDDLVRATILAIPVPKQIGRRIHLGERIRHAARHALAASRADRHVVDERDPMAAAHGQRLVPTVGVERGVSQFPWILHGYIDLRFAVGMTHD